MNEKRRGIPIIISGDDGPPGIMYSAKEHAEMAQEAVAAEIASLKEQLAVANTKLEAQAELLYEGCVVMGADEHEKDMAWIASVQTALGIDAGEPRARELVLEVLAANTALKAWTDEDQPLPEDEAIKAAFPTRSGEHETYGEAMRLVGAKRSKFALVDLVNWLLVQVKEENSKLHKALDHYAWDDPTDNGERAQAALGLSGGKKTDG